jgi:hypothetical protein
MIDDRAEPTNPAASEAPLEEPVSRPSLDEDWAKKFAKAVGEEFKSQLRPVLDHIENEDVERGKLLRVLSELSDDFKLMANEVRASRTEAVAWHQKFENLSDRVDRHRDLISDLRKTVGDHGERIVELEKTGTDEE